MTNRLDVEFLPKAMIWVCLGWFGFLGGKVPI